MRTGEFLLTAYLVGGLISAFVAEEWGDAPWTKLSRVYITLGAWLPILIVFLSMRLGNEPVMAENEMVWAARDNNGEIIATGPDLQALSRYISSMDRRDLWFRTLHRGIRFVRLESSKALTPSQRALQRWRMTSQLEGVS